MSRTLRQYQQFTRTTAVYPGAGTGSMGAVMYCALEVSDEAGEVAGKLKKLYRDNKLDKEELKKEIGDVMWPLARLCDELDMDLQDCLNKNVEKLSDRSTRGTLQGSGDNR